MTALDVETRRSGERDLLSLYLAELRRFGVDPPSWDDAWLLYRRQMVWGILAWLVTPTAMYSEPLLGALIRRCAQAANDHDTYTLLGV